MLLIADCVTVKSPAIVNCHRWLKLMNWWETVWCTSYLVTFRYIRKARNWYYFDQFAASHVPRQRFWSFRTHLVGATCLWTRKWDKHIIGYAIWFWNKTPRGYNGSHLFNLVLQINMVVSSMRVFGAERAIQECWLPDCSGCTPATLRHLIYGKVHMTHINREPLNAPSCID